MSAADESDGNRTAGEPRDYPIAAADGPGRAPTLVRRHGSTRSFPPVSVDPDGEVPTNSLRVGGRPLVRPWIIRSVRRLFSVLGLALVTGSGCVGAPGDGSVDVSGALYTDVRNDAVCADMPRIEELAGVTLRFTDGSGEVLSTTATGPLTTEELEQGPGMVGWTAFGCRYLAPFAVELPRAEVYEIAFTPSPIDATSSFAGVEMLAPQRIRFSELEAAAFRWAIEVGPTYVVP
jgi:hypothetical protein